jgi:hypothetical protein
VFEAVKAEGARRFRRRRSVLEGNFVRFADDRRGVEAADGEVDFRRLRVVRQDANALVEDAAGARRVPFEENRRGFAGAERFVRNFKIGAKTAFAAVGERQRFVADVFDLERMFRTDRLFDVGRLAGELKHYFMFHTGDKYKAEPFIGHFLWEYSCHFPDRERTFKSLTSKMPFYIGETLLRIARNDYLDIRYRKTLIKEAILTLQRDKI